MDGELLQGEIFFCLNFGFLHHLGVVRNILQKVMGFINHEKFSLCQVFRRRDYYEFSRRVNKTGSILEISPLSLFELCTDSPGF